MTLAADLSASDESTSHPEPATPQDILRRAHDIAATLVQRQAETEQRTYYAEDTHRAFAEAGFYRLLVPRRFGGYEFGVDTFFQVVKILARACPSTAWMYCLGATHAIPAATLFSERAQQEIFQGTDFIAPATIVPGGSAQRQDDGTWLLNGTWNYCSGSPYATHFIGHTLTATELDAPPIPVLFIAPRSQWRRLDDWGGQLGLRGSGSHSITIRNGRVPDHFVLPGSHISEVDVTAGTPGRALHGNPQYGGGQLSYMVLEAAVLAVGIAQGALDAYADLMRSRTTLLPPFVSRTENVDYQFWYGEAAGMIATAEAAADNAVKQWQDMAAQGPGAFTREQDIRLTTICRHVIKLCWHAVEQHIFPTAGSSAVRHGERIERVWRDLSMLQSHSGFGVFLPTVANRDLARLRFGAASGVFS
ncbi:acyl-CoA dehydrogenase family protein [Catellatospora methionotrophica]|uniref:acyl-CoA dehydrogenase family protein n=1 Tax=Catellatospora methionotrophica TaxID=121620 RepID=UPI0033E44B91